MICSDLRQPESDDPEGAGFVLGAVSALVFSLLALCGIALVRGWGGTAWWLLFPAGLIAWFARSYVLSMS